MSSEVLVRAYTGGNQSEAAARYGDDAVLLSSDGWIASSQAWVEGDWSRRAYAAAALLILAGGLGLVLLIVMALVKPKRTLLVTYNRRLPIGTPEPA